MANTEPASTLLCNARIVLANRTLESANLLIENGRIAAISDGSESAARNIDLAGLTLFPGLIDIHIHGGVGVDMLSARPEDLRHLAEFLAAKGVTAWLPTLVPAQASEYEQAIRVIGECMSHAARDEPALECRLQSGVSIKPNNPIEVSTQTPAARVLGVHYEGPFVNREQCGALHREHFRVFDTVEKLDSLPTIKVERAIHMMTVAPEIEGGIALIKELAQRNWVVSIGHTRATADILDQAMAAGARHLTHFMNAMTPLHHRKLGAVGWGLIHDELTCDLIADGIHLDREILKFVIRSKSPETVSLISDAVAAAGLGDGDYEIWGETISVKNGRTQNSSGNIAGSVITMLDAVRLMLSLGFSEPEVAVMAALNPALLLGIAAECGSIEIGKRADLVALDDNLNVRMTIIAGVTSAE